MSNLYDGVSGTVSRTARCDLALEIEALEQSNYIEREYSDIALKDAIDAWSAVNSSWYRGESNIGFKLVWRIKEIHGNLLFNLNPRIAGKLRTCNVAVGGRFIPFTSEALLKEELGEWIKNHDRADTEELIKQAHIAFEKIHPFEDGNGRVGRIIMMWQRKRAGLPVKVIHTGKEQQEYYKWFEGSEG